MMMVKPYRIHLAGPKYRLFDNASPALTVINPKPTKSTLGKQHMLAKNADPKIQRHNERASCDSVML